MLASIRTRQVECHSCRGAGIAGTDVGGGLCLRCKDEGGGAIWPPPHSRVFTDSLNGP